MIELGSVSANIYDITITNLEVFRGQEALSRLKTANGTIPAPALDFLPGYFMPVRREAAQTGVDTRRAQAINQMFLRIRRRETPRSPYQAFNVSFEEDKSLSR